MVIPVKTDHKVCYQTFSIYLSAISPRATLKAKAFGHEHAVQNDNFRYKGWSVELLRDNVGWKALVYGPHSPLHQAKVPSGHDRQGVLEEAKVRIHETLTL